jgi:hypothetical protein
MNPEHRIEDEKMARPENNEPIIRRHMHDWMVFCWVIRNLTAADLEEQGLQYSDYQLETFKTSPDTILEEADAMTRLRIWRAIEVRRRRRVLDIPRWS